MGWWQIDVNEHHFGVMWWWKSSNPGPGLPKGGLLPSSPLTNCGGYDCFFNSRYKSCCSLIKTRQPYCPIHSQSIHVSPGCLSTEIGGGGWGVQCPNSLTVPPGEVLMALHHKVAVSSCLIQRKALRAQHTMVSYLRKNDVTNTSIFLVLCKWYCKFMRWPLYKNSVILYYDFW